MSTAPPQKEASGPSLTTTIIAILALVPCICCGGFYGATGIISALRPEPKKSADTGWFGLPKGEEVVTRPGDIRELADPNFKCCTRCVVDSACGDICQPDDAPCNEPPGCACNVTRTEWVTE